MSTDPSGAPGEPGASAGGAPGQPSEQELRAAYEAELSRITSADMMLQAAVSLLNIGSYRLAGPPPAGEGASQAASGRDLEQVRVYAASHYVTPRPTLNQAIDRIKAEFPQAGWRVRGLADAGGSFQDLGHFHRGVGHHLLRPDVSGWLDFLRRVF